MGSSNGSEAFVFNPFNPGNSGINLAQRGYDELYKSIRHEYINTEEVQTMTLDHFLEIRNINADDMDYIWLDTEGYEDEIVIGAVDTLTKRKIPLMQEFNPRSYQKCDAYYSVIEKVYDHFIVFDEYLNNNINKHPVSSLGEFAESMKQNGTLWADLFFF